MLLVIFFVAAFWSGSLSAQGKGAGKDSKKSPPPKDDLDYEFYNDYLDSLPDDRQKRSRKILIGNFLRILKMTIPRDDPVNGRERAKKLTEKEVNFKKVTIESAFVRGILREMPYIKPTSHMYIIKAEPYIVFVTFKANPMIYLMREFQSHTVIKAKEKDDGSHAGSGG